MIVRIISDITCVLAVHIFIILIYAFAKPYERGFYCNDESIRYPYKDSTVPTYVLFTAGLLLPAIALAFMERFITNGATQIMTNVQLIGYQIPNWLTGAYKVIGVFIFGAGCTSLVIACSQYVTGYLRPYFIDVCRPNVNCSSPCNHFRYITNYSCTTNLNRLITTARLTFPSGHAALSAYSMTFLVIYLQVKLKRFGTLLIVNSLQLICICVGVFIALSRLSDHKHHLIDVIIGIIVGVFSALAVTMCILNFRNTEDGQMKSNLD